MYPPSCRCLRIALQADPGTIAINRAAMIGTVIAEAMARNDHRSFMLVGQSRRAIVTAAQALSACRWVCRETQTHGPHRVCRGIAALVVGLSFAVAGTVA